MLFVSVLVVHAAATAGVWDGALVCVYVCGDVFVGVCMCGDGSECPSSGICVSDAFSVGCD